MLGNSHDSYATQCVRLTVDAAIENASDERAVRAVDVPGWANRPRTTDRRVQG